MLDLLRFLIGMAILLYASYTDFKYRIARNELWMIAGAAGLLLMLFSNYSLPKVLFSVMLMLSISFSLLFFGMGGADAKALVAISLLVPLFPRIGSLPLWMAPVEFPFPLIIFVNSLLLFLLIPLAFFVWNMKKGVFEFPFYFFGYKMKASEIKEKFVWPMEKIEDGKRKKTVLPQKDLNPEIFGDGVIWVTPKVPFLIPLTAGYFISFILGDILYKIISLFI
ncbi:MAG: A24 family peptidase C-terminal domain-containing protein [Candidatus Thermoplasmatota archaeon]|nr:A24 family peptidase C-terminal domain-containing protein [Candidatus Thermoplasmatota archaeon]